MPKQKIFSVGFQFPGGEAEQHAFESKQSLLDADIVVYQPTRGTFHSLETYQSKPYLSEDQSFRFKECLAHWRFELMEAYEAGKVIFLFLAQPSEIFVRTGQRETSGTGRNQKVTHIVAKASSYDAIPMSLKTQTRSGTEIIPTLHAGFLDAYWSEFGQMSPYEVTIEGKFSKELLKTRSGGALVGAELSGKKGAIILLPPLDYDNGTISLYEALDGEEFWSHDAQALGRRLASSLCALATAAKSGTVVTPPPSWAQDEDYRLPEADRIHTEILARTNEMEKIRAEKSELDDELSVVVRLRGLLYEQGHELERVTAEALTLMGFSVAHFQDNESEFDMVFSSPEGRFLGEAEGKDKRPINIDKLRQLESNIQEDFAKDDVNEYARGVLFGNAERLAQPSKRGEAFTAKCMSGAERSGIALVNTADLFEPARYLSGYQDSGYRAECRKAIIDAKRQIAVFPKPPELHVPDGGIPEESS